jgi:endo-1,3(4)-beta-glucanase
MFALPHLVESFSSTTKAAAKDVKLQTTTKGVATAVVADSWTMEEPDMPVGMGFAPWSPSLGNIAGLSEAAISSIQKVATSDLKQDMSAQSNGDSFYFSGKVCQYKSVKFRSLANTWNYAGTCQVCSSYLCLQGLS